MRDAWNYSDRALARGSGSDPQVRILVIANGFDPSMYLLFASISQRCRIARMIRPAVESGDGLPLAKFRSPDPAYHIYGIRNKNS